VNNLLYNLPTEMEADEKHILSVFVENTSGTLSKISGLLAARGFNIDTLTVASSNIAGVSRMTVVLSCSHSQMLQARKQVEDLVVVWAVVDASANAIKREMVLAKISTFPPSSSLSPFMEGNEEQPTGDRAPTYDDLMEAAAHRESVTALAVMFGAEVVDVGTNQIILELVSWQRRVDAFLRAIEPFGIIEVARSGAIAMERSEVAETDTSRDSKERSALQEQDISALPPS
jgi:acetolactate synthase-1/3 small subunit